MTTILGALAVSGAATLAFWGMMLWGYYWTLGGTTERMDVAYLCECGRLRVRPVCRECRSR